MCCVCVCVCVVCAARARAHMHAARHSQLPLPPAAASSVQTHRRCVHMLYLHACTTHTHIARAIAIKMPSQVVGFIERRNTLFTTLLSPLCRAKRCAKHTQAKHYSELSTLKCDIPPAFEHCAAQRRLTLLRVRTGQHHHAQGHSTHTHHHHLLSRHGAPVLLLSTLNLNFLGRKQLFTTLGGLSALEELVLCSGAHRCHLVGILYGRTVATPRRRDGSALDSEGLEPARSRWPGS
jgi:hypothetical protein